MGNKKHIVILGAGYGGVLTAKKIAKKFKKNDDITLTVIDKNTYHTMLTELHEVAANRVPEESIRISLEKIFAGRKVNIVLDEITDIDFESRVLKGQSQEYHYDYLVLGTGSKPTFFGCVGAEEHTLKLWSYEDAIKIKEHILGVFAKASKERSAEKRKQLLTFVVVGSGFTGIEMIGEIAEWVEQLCRDFYIKREDVRLCVVDILPRVLPTFNEKAVIKVEKRLEKLGIEVLTNSNIIEVAKDEVYIRDKASIKTYTTIWAAGIEGSDILANVNPDQLKKVLRNRVETDRYLRATNHDNVFVVGDNIFFVPEGSEYCVPQMVENAEHSAGLVGHNIVADIEKEALKEYKPKFHGAMLCVGGRYGVAQVGTEKKQYVCSGFLALLIKHFINMIYLIQVAGFNQVWSYMMHEFFHVNHRRSLVGGHFSKRSPNFFLVPLRLFLGVKWLLEGVNKIGRVLNDPTDIFLFPVKVEGVSGASEAVEAALPVPDFVGNMVDWSMNLIFYHANGEFTVFATIFQTLMVLAEIGIGLALMAGLFTALASIVSVLMGMMIWSSGMAPTEMLWYIFGAIALIGGSGSTFGMDYYVLPFLKKRWKQLKFVKKWYLST